MVGQVLGAGSGTPGRSWIQGQGTEDASSGRVGRQPESLPPGSIPEKEAAEIGRWAQSCRRKMNARSSHYLSVSTITMDDCKRCESKQAQAISGRVLVDIVGSNLPLGRLL